MGRVAVCLSVLSFAGAAGAAESPARWEGVYERSATTGLVSGIAAPIVPPVATTAGYFVARESLGPAPNVFDMCDGPAVVLCVLLFPALVPAQLVAMAMWAVLPVAISLVVTAPLYVAGPPLVAGSAMRGRKALGALGYEVPHFWGDTAWVLWGAETAAVAGFYVGTAASASGAPVLAPVALAGWAGSLGAGLLQWRANRRHYVGKAGTPSAARRGLEVPVLTLSGSW